MSDYDVDMDWHISAASQRIESTARRYVMSQSLIAARSSLRDVIVLRFSRFLIPPNGSIKGYLVYCGYILRES